MWSVVPACPPHDAKAAISRQPRTAVTRVSRVCCIPTILSPIPGIAMHIIKTPRIGGKAVHGHRRLAGFATGATRIGNAAIVVGLLGGYRGAPPERRN